jgi:hypothetical protein
MIPCWRGSHVPLGLLIIPMYRYKDNLLNMAVLSQAKWPETF